MGQVSALTQPSSQKKRLFKMSLFPEPCSSPKAPSGWTNFMAEETLLYCCCQTVEGGSCQGLLITEEEE